MNASDFNLSEGKFGEVRSWVYFQERIRKFRNNHNLTTFEEIFGEAEGLRLFRHYRFDCDYNFDKFLTYLRPEQKNLLLPYIAENYDI
jgi:hypothetical protein